jgi:hypothetical protein
MSELLIGLALRLVLQPVILLIATPVVLVGCFGGGPY